MAVVASPDDFEPLLDDDRVDRIAGLVRLSFPTLPVDTQFFTFVVPPQKVERDGEEVEIPAQAVFAVQSAHPRRTFDAFYRDKELMSNTACWLPIWEREERQRMHFVSGPDDPAFGPFSIAARNHLRAIKNLKELI